MCPRRVRRPTTPRAGPAIATASERTGHVTTGQGARITDSALIIQRGADSLAVRRSTTGRIPREGWAARIQCVVAGLGLLCIIAAATAAICMRRAAFVYA